MSNKKLSQEILDHLEDWLKSLGKYEYFKYIKKAKTCQLRQSGAFLYLLLKLGYSPIEIDQLLDIRVKTIERRILTELKELDAEKDTYEAYVFLFENVTGLPWSDIYRLYMRSNFSESIFLARECIDRETFKKIKNLFSTKGAIKYENEVRLKMKELNKKESENGDNTRYTNRRRKGRLIQIYRLA